MYMQKILNKPPAFHITLLLATLAPLYIGSYQYRLRHPSGLTTHHPTTEPPATASATFIRDWLAVHVVDPFNPSPIATYCNQTVWRPRLVFNLVDANGGIGNIRGNFLDFLFYAIEAGASIMLPSMATRSAADLSNVWASRGDFDLFFDEDWFLSALAQACPQMVVYKPRPELGMVDPLPGTYSPPSRRMDVDAGNLREAFRRHLGEWLREQGENEEGMMTAEEEEGGKVVLVNVGRTLWEVDTRSLPPGFRRNFGQLLRINPVIRRLAAIEVQQLATQRNLAIDPRVAIPPHAFYGAHLRTEADAQAIGWLHEPYTNFSAQTDAYIAHALHHHPGLRTLYVSSGSADEISRFAAKAAAHAPPLTVLSKHSLLPPQALRDLDALSWDQQALVDFEVLHRASVFGGFVKSSFSYNIAMTRAQWGEDRGRAVEPWRVVHEEMGVAFDDGLSRVVGRDGWHEGRIPRGMWP
ncbi:hypothetical protein KC318_g5791 [Hortaea werneckii]|uniref:Alternative oxidase n=1 Tax=Hortaea werneckii TaxID=91943 RepID=A0A3M6YAM7_HORWE|nr:hypothetical protein KC334_g13169 [Hortaea werneckii]KAI7025498.1 hypothetical protein KC355_g987 [Hortaea werneckii]KAI7667588.1 hypothetical protein KC318_g5791 [Hortaea werneckii]RMY00100.1 hypothetical protein D0867_11864 [Hortaea werneckii]RMY20241.1 hypothetical protein D0866_12592 [Hortaea werneckii]